MMYLLLINHVERFPSPTSLCCPLSVFGCPSHYRTLKLCVYTQSSTEWFLYACYPADISEIMPKTKKDRFSIVVSGFLSDGILFHFSFRKSMAHRAQPKKPSHIETFCHKSLYGFALRSGLYGFCGNLFIYSSFFFG